MSRPTKQGLDYFPMDVNMDEKVELIEAKYHCAGFCVLVKMYQKIYNESYYTNWNEETAFIFSKRINVDVNLVNDIINDCIKYKLFDADLYEKYGILTSEGIQKRYLLAIARRKDITLDKRFVIVDINSVNVYINWINDDISTQSKVKESKGKNIKEEPEKIPEESKPDFFDSIVKEFLSVFTDYKITTPGKEKAMAGKLFQVFKKQYPYQNTEEILKTLHNHFDRCKNEIDDPFHRDRMSLSYMVTQFNTIANVLKAGSKKKHLSGVQDLSKQDYSLKPGDV